VFSALFWALTFAGVTLFNSFEIGSREYKDLQGQKKKNEIIKYEVVDYVCH